jgi:hypothetical protein
MLEPIWKVGSHPGGWLPGDRVSGNVKAVNALWQLLKKMSSGTSVRFAGSGNGMSVVEDVWLVAVELGD